MEPTADHTSENRVGRRPALQSANGRASVTEMRESLAGIHKVNPEQVMGVGQEGGLARSMVAATIGTTVLMLACTIGPYALDRMADAKPKQTPPAQAEKQAVAAPEAAAAEKSVAEKSPSEKSPVKAPAEAGAPVVAKSTLERLGVDEVKQSAPDVNPLESKLDDLLDKTK